MTIKSMLLYASIYIVYVKISYNLFMLDIVQLNKRVERGGWVSTPPHPPTTDMVNKRVYSTVKMVNKLIIARFCFFEV